MRSRRGRLDPDIDMQRAPRPPRVSPRPHLYRALGLALCAALAGGCQRRSGPVIVEKPARPAEPVEDAATAAAVEQVRRGYLGRDWWACARDGAALQEKHPDSPRLRAWTILCAARSGVDALPQAEAMLAETPGDPWALFARAGALIDHPTRGKQEAIPAARLAMAALHEHPDAVWQLGRALVVHGTHLEKAQFFGVHGGATAELLALELASVLNSMDTKEEQVLGLAARARAADPTNVDAALLPGIWLLNRRQPLEAGPLLARALELSPHSPAVHARLWEALLQASDPGAGAEMPSEGAAVGAPEAASAGESLSWEALLQASLRGPEARRATLDAAVARLLAARADAPAAWKAAADVYAELAPELRDKYEAELLARFPASREAEWTRTRQVYALTKARHERTTKHKPDPTADAEMRARLEAILRDHPPAQPAVLAHLYMGLHALLRDDKETPPELLLANLRRWLEHEQYNFHTFSDAALDLAERTSFKAEAEATVREAIRKTEAMLAERTAAMIGAADLIEASGNYQRGLLYSALGSVLLAQGRLEDARAAFAPVLALPDKSPEVLVRLAAFAEADGRVADAKRHLVKGLAQWRGEETCGEALRALYRRQHGSDRGYARHRAQLEASLREERRAQVLATALAEPKPLPPFVMPRLGGEEVRSESLLGRVAVLNFWGKWCVPCVAEMPALQQLADAYAKDPEVAVMTVNVDPLTDELPAWLAERGLRLEVLLGGRWFEEHGDHTLPLTLFVDPAGRIAFEHTGATERLVEEFSWRIEALRGAGLRRAG